MSTGWGSGEMEGFIEHCECMNDFLRHHDARQTGWTSPVNKMLPYDVRYGLLETGGSAEALGEADWCLLLPLREVTGRQVVPN